MGPKIEQHRSKIDLGAQGPPKSAQGPPRGAPGSHFGAILELFWSHFWSHFGLHFRPPRGFILERLWYTRLGPIASNKCLALIIRQCPSYPEVDDPDMWLEGVGLDPASFSS